LKQGGEEDATRRGTMGRDVFLPLRRGGKGEGSGGESYVISWQASFSNVKKIWKARLMDSGNGFIRQESVKGKLGRVWSKLKGGDIPPSSQSNQGGWVEAIHEGKEERMEEPREHSPTTRDPVRKVVCRGKMRVVTSSPIRQARAQGGLRKVW